jgi:hypothetical protein
VFPTKSVFASLFQAPKNHAAQLLGLVNEGRHALGEKAIRGQGLQRPPPANLGADLVRIYGVLISKIEHSQPATNIQLEEPAQRIGVCLAEILASEKPHPGIDSKDFVDLVEREATLVESGKNYLSRHLGVIFSEVPSPDNEILTFRKPPQPYEKLLVWTKSMHQRNTLQKSMPTDTQIPKVRFCDLDCDIQVHSYNSTGAPALQLMNPEVGPVATATVNMPDVALAADEVLIKDYSENQGMAKAFEEAGIGKVVDTLKLSFGSEVKKLQVTNPALLGEIERICPPNDMDL